MKHFPIIFEDWTVDEVAECTRVSTDSWCALWEQVPAEGPAPDLRKVWGSLSEVVQADIQGAAKELEAELEEIRKELENTAL